MKAAESGAFSPAPLDAQSELGKRMKPRHLVMMSLGCAIGTGLFVGMGKAIAVAGPAVLVAFGFASLLVILIIRMIGEMAAANPNSGALSVYVGNALGPTAGITVGWLWWLTMVISIASEATATAVILHAYWPSLPQWALALSFVGGFTIINLAGSSKFGEMEFWFAGLKIAVIIAFIGVGVAILAGVVPHVPSPGLSNLFSHGGFMPTGLAGVGAALLIVTFTYGGTEIIAIAAAETEDPKRNISRAIRSMLYRIVLFFVVPVAIMVTVLPWNSSDLKAGPFVAILKLAGIPGVEVMITMTIALALLSSLNANIYGASRLIFSLAERGSAPRRFTRLAANRVPRAAMLASVAFGFAAVAMNYLWPETVLMLLLNAVGSVNMILWASAIVSQIILRRRADRDPSVELPVKMWAFPYLSYLAAAMMAAFVVVSLFHAESRNQMITTGVSAAAIALIYQIRGRRVSAGSAARQ
ncbi:amino acid permease [Pandoraea pulmonicola]|uniref:Amino acid transporter n=1 Tax=Pandoraea pulmonicola TaxID=93221 RepID=A0AAJ4ZG83_PANPU|nr:amino acid permease [Pandoraea pulmonicola]AJC22909.1 amino acid transporter [Pandoraea pulmonicola]SUA92757.1 Gamma-aminobutyrate permease [Pandoraea pulmonicola]